MDTALVGKIDLMLLLEGTYISLTDMMFVHVLWFAANTLETWREVSKSEVKGWYGFSNVDG